MIEFKFSVTRGYCGVAEYSNMYVLVVLHFIVDLLKAWTFLVQVVSSF